MGALIMGYICECGAEFEHPQKFNGHKGHCKIHLAAVGKLDSYADRQARASATGRNAYNEQQRARKLQKLIDWLAAAHTCERCGKIMTLKFGTGRFCSRSCANTRDVSEETKEKIRQSASVINQSGVPRIKRRVSTSGIPWVKVRHQECLQEYELNPKKCTVCGNILPYKRRTNSTCGEAFCKHEAFVRAGKRSANAVSKRSKNEIDFCNLCENYFGIDNVLHNEPMFNGWDADIIIPEYKLAILWNGPWHYRKITEKHSLEQVQNRDRIKVNEITNCGYIPYVIEDLAKASSKKVQEEFSRLLSYLATPN